MLALLIYTLLAADDLGALAKNTTRYENMRNDCNSVFSNNHDRLRDVVERNNYGFFNNRELCEKMAQVIINDKSPDQLEYSKKHAAISLLLCHVDSSTSEVVIDALIRNIQFRDPFASAMLTRDQQYPCLACLLKIGRKAAEKILYYVANSDDQVNNTYLARWFLLYYGQDDGIYVISNFYKKHSPVLTNVQRSRIEAFVEIKMGGTIKK